MARLRGGRRSGFTLIELLVVLAIVAFLTALLLPALQHSRCRSERAACVNNLKQLALVMHNYQTTWSTFPPGYVGGGPRGADAGPGWAWGVLLLPYLDQSVLYNTANLGRPVTAPDARTVRTAALEVFLCPIDDPTAPASLDFAPSHYVACGGTDSAADHFDGMFDRNVGRRLADVIDGTSNTFLIGERSRTLADSAWAGVVPDGLFPGVRHATNPDWKRPSSGPAFAMVLGFTGPPNGRPTEFVGVNSPTSGHDAFFAIHEGGANFALVDGSVRYVGGKMSPGLYHASGTIAGADDQCGVEAY